MNKNSMIIVLIIVLTSCAGIEPVTVKDNPVKKEINKVEPTIPPVNISPTPAQAIPTPIVFSSSAPYEEPGMSSDIKELTNFNGTLFDMDGKVLDGVTVSAKSIDYRKNWVGEPQEIINGVYSFNNAPVGTRIEITATKQGFSTRTQTVVLKSNHDNNPDANTYDFGGTSKGGNGDAAKYALQDEPEITYLKVNGKEASYSGEIGIYVGEVNAEGTVNTTDTETGVPFNGGYYSKPFSKIQKNNNLNYRPNKYSSVGISGVDNSKLEVEMKFSEPVDRKSVETNLRILSQVRDSSFQIDSSPEAVPGTSGQAVSGFTIDSRINPVTFTWSNNDQIVIFNPGKPLLINESGTEARYKVTFANKFRDKGGLEARSATEARGNADTGLFPLYGSIVTGASPTYINNVTTNKESIKPGGFIKYSTSVRADYLTFSMRNDETAFKMESISANNNLNGVIDRVSVNFNKFLEVFGNNVITSDFFKMDITAFGGTALRPAILMNGKVLGYISKYDAAGINQPWGSKEYIDYGLVNNSKTIYLNFNPASFDLKDSIFLELDKEFKAPSGKTISIDNESIKPVGGTITVTTSDRAKVTVAN